MVIWSGKVKGERNNEYTKMFNVQKMEKRILVYRMQL